MWADVPVFPPKEPSEETVQTSIRIPSKLLARVDEIAAAEGHSRNAAITYLLRAGVRAYEDEQAADSKAKRRQ